MGITWKKARLFCVFTGRVVLLNSPPWSETDPIVSTGSRSDLNARSRKGFMDGAGIDKAIRP
jgi:hypothetical protein